MGKENTRTLKNVNHNAKKNSKKTSKKNSKKSKKNRNEPSTTEEMRNILNSEDNFMAKKSSNNFQQYDRDIHGIDAHNAMNEMNPMKTMMDMPDMATMQGMQGMNGMHGMQGMQGMPGMQGMQGMQGMPGMFDMQNIDPMMVQQMGPVPSAQNMPSNLLSGSQMVNQMGMMGGGRTLQMKKVKNLTMLSGIRRLR